MELSLARVEGGSSLNMLTPEHETKRGDGDGVKRGANALVQ